MVLRSRRPGRSEQPVARGATRTVTEAARDCLLMTRARALAVFLGDGKPVTAKAVLRRSDIPAACAASGLPDPGRVVSAAHVPALQRAWVAARGAGLITVGRKTAQAGVNQDDAIDQWRYGVAAVLRAESDDPGRRGAAVVCTAALDMLADASGLADPWFGDALERALDALPLREQLTVGYAFRRGLLPETGAAELLADIGAIDRTTRTVTPLGHWARTEIAQPPAPRLTWAGTDALELRIDLERLRPPVWRRVRLPAATTLSELHEVIQILFEWDGDHLHVFTVDGARYADPYHELDGCADTDELTLAAALPRPGARLAYRYDLGDCWDHTVLLENGGPTPAPSTRPVCIGGRGDAPVEDWSDDEPPPRPLNLAGLDRRLAKRWA